MKLASFLTLASLAVSAVFAQVLEIGLPQPGTNITPGQNLTVQLLQPDSIEGPQYVAIVISLFDCSPQSGCPSPSGELGSILYQGPFNPQFPPPPTTQHVPQQNFTVTVPSYFQANSIAQFVVTFFFLIGAGPAPELQQVNETLNVT